MGLLDGSAREFIGDGSFNYYRRRWRGTLKEKPGNYRKNNDCGGKHKSDIGKTDGL
jgi:hypothetical protein